MTIYYYPETDETMLVDIRTRHPWYLISDAKQYKFHRWSEFDCGAKAWSTAYKKAIKITVY